MEEQKMSIRGIGFKYGILSAIAFIAYFLIMRAINLAQQTELRHLNYVFLAGGIFLALNEIRHKIHTHRINYLPGIGVGLWASVVSSVIFGIFMVVYTGAIEPGFLERIKPSIPASIHLNAGMVGFVAFGETMVWGVIISFVLMQLFKRNRTSRDESKEEAAEGKIFHPHVKHSKPL
jgi:hypothetical protein